jgi:hypothetical protein
MPDVAKINAFLQRKLKREQVSRVAAVEAAKWLDEAGLLVDRKEGLPLRNLLRDGEITGSSQEPPQKYGRWYINRVT